MARKATIDDVARLAGVSVATVDRVLNGRGGVAPERERRVLASARQVALDRALNRGYARRLRVAVLIQSAANPFHAALAQAFAAEGRTSADLNIQFLVNHIDPNRPDRTAAAVLALGERHEGLIVTSPADPNVAAALRKMSTAIPVVTLATDIPDSGRRVYVGPDDRRAGRVAGELMGRYMGTEAGEVLVIVGLRSIAGHREREAGFRAVLAEHHPGCRVALVEESREDEARAAEIATAALRARPSLRGLYLASAGARAVAEALRAEGRLDMIFVTHELTDDRRALLRDRTIHAVVDQDPAAEVRVAVETMARLLGRLEGEASPDSTPVRIFTAENA